MRALVNRRRGVRFLSWAAAFLLTGSSLLAGTDPGNGFVLVSSRASYEMVLKSASFGVEVLVAVSAPTALAIDFARKSGLTLVGFARPRRHNVYTFPERIMDQD